MKIITLRYLNFFVYKCEEKIHKVKNSYKYIPIDQRCFYCIFMTNMTSVCDLNSPLPVI